MGALSTAVSGLQNFQTDLNVIANNLANLNTTGFKASRVENSDLAYQSIHDAAAASAGTGGTDPAQVGLGSSVSAVSVNDTQGNLENTGVSTDLAIQGNGFFVMGNGSGSQFYSRDGATSVGSTGQLFSSVNGLDYLGWNATNGSIDTTAPVGSVVIPLGQALAAKATSTVSFSGNLDAGGNTTQGTVTSTQALLGAAQSTNLATALKNSAGVSLGIQPGNVIGITGSIGGTAMSGQSITVTANTTLADIAAALQTAVDSQNSSTATAAVQSNGSILVTADSTHAITNLQLTITGNSAFNNAFDYPSAIGTSSTGASNTLRTPATSSTKLEGLYDPDGNSLGLVDGDDITLVNAVVGSNLITNQSVLSSITSSTTYGQYASALQTALFTAFPGTGESVAVQSDGSMKVTGANGASNAVTGLNIGAGPTADSNTRTVFADGEVFTQSQEALDATTFQTTSQVYDSLGDVHTLTMAFTKSAANTWSWNATDSGSSVGSGALTFSSTGALTSASGTISLTLANGAASPQAISPDFSDAVQYASASSLNSSNQDGYASSTLSNFSIGPDGTVTGIFSNGQTRTVAQLALATFSNAGGLSQNGSNLLAESANSGAAVINPAGSGGSGTLVSGALEDSNVDVASEFTDMITAQRGFEANSRAITTEDQVLQDLNQLGR